MDENYPAQRPVFFTSSPSTNRPAVQARHPAHMAARPNVQIVRPPGTGNVARPIARIGGPPIPSPLVHPNHTPGVHQNPAPRVHQNHTPHVHQNLAPRVQQNPTPHVHQDQMPRVHQNLAPRVQQNPTPHVHQNQMPRVHQNLAPRVQQNPTPHVHQKHIPRVHQNLEPRVHQNQMSCVHQNQAPHVPLGPAPRAPVQQPARFPVPKAAVPTRNYTVVKQLVKAAEAYQPRNINSLGEFVNNLDEYMPTIPDAVTEHYMRTAGLPNTDPRIVRLISLATQKFMADIINDAAVRSKIEQIQSGVPPAKRSKQARMVLTTELLQPILRERGIEVISPEFFT